MKTFRMLLAFALLIGASRAGNARAQRAPYVVEVRKRSGALSLDRVRLRSRATGRVLWTRMTDGYGVNWSPDHRAVAVEAVVEGRWRLLVQREGYRLRDFATPSGNDYTMGIEWSPDNRRLLIRAGASGDSDVDAGRLYCLKLRRGNRYKLLFVATGVRRMEWRGNRRFVYWTLGDFNSAIGGFEVSGPYTRRVP